MKFFPKKISLPKISLPNSLSKMNYNFNPILHNRIILYFISILALFDIIYFLNKGDIISFVTFVLVGFLTSFFSKNMIVIFVIAMSITHILKYGNSGYINEGFKEGMDNEDENDTNVTTSKNSSSSDSSSDKPSSSSDKLSSSDKPSSSSDKLSSSSTKKSSKKIDETFEGKNNIEYSELKKEYKEFQGIQDKIMKNLSDIEPALQKAEDFIKKFESYKEGLGKNNK